MSWSPLSPGERLIEGDFPMLCYHQAGVADRPLVMLAPGGGHLARIFYGHPGARPSDFICHWLALRGYEVLAISYPSNHEANPHLRPGMTVADWAAGMIAAAEGCVPSIRAREIVLAGWSMCGRLAHAFKAAANRAGIETETFIGQAATAPRGEPRIGTSPSASGAEMAQMLGSFAYTSYPYCGAVIPTSPLDARHALTDRATWGFINAQKAWFDARAVGLFDTSFRRAEVWEELRQEISTLPQRLTREVPAGISSSLAGEAPNLRPLRSTS